MALAWKWVAVLACVTALAGLMVLPAASTSHGWPIVAGMVLVGFLWAIAVLIVKDSAARGRSGWRWLIACAFLAPLAVPVFVVVAVFDRLHGRPGIESRWAPPGRWLWLAAVILAVTATAFAVSQIQVPGASVSTPTASGSFSGACSSALSVSLGGGPYGQVPAGAGPVLTAAQTTVADRCSAAAGSRMSASAACLGGALLLALAGLGLNRRRGRSQLRHTLASP